MRLLAAQAREGTASEREGLSIAPGPWLARTLGQLLGPTSDADADPGPALRGSLRPYQRDGVAWLYLLARLGLGGCLADDMGLGKTIQVIALLLLLQRDGERGPHLIVMPASLLGHWQAELARLAPTSRVAVAHARNAWLRQRRWGVVVRDEAQAIKNAGTQQARSVKSLASRVRFALTGTPVENRLGELWSLFDFLCPGLLGSAQEFTRFTRRASTEGGAGYAPLRRLVKPYVLRRMKTDRTIVGDLPDKT